MKRKLVAMTMACTLAATALTGCGGSSDGGSSSAADTKTDSAAADSTAAETTASDAEGSVYYLNFKPEQDQAVAGSGKSLHRRDRRTGNRCNSSFRKL